MVVYGLAGTTLERIAQAAGISRSNLAHFVGNRDEIIDMAVADSVTRFTDAMMAGVDHLPPAEQLPAFIDRVLGTDDSVLRTVTLVNELFAAASREGHVRDVLAPAMHRIDGWVARMVADRYPDADADIRSAVGVVLPFILRERDRMRVIGGGDAAVVAHVRAAVDVLLDQLGPPAH